MTDVFVIPAVQVAVDALQQRQRVIADNVANINTPGYQARGVDFENALASAVSSMPGADAAQLSSSSVTTSFTGDPSREDGNNVSLERETLLGTKTNQQFQLALRAVDFRFQTFRDVIKGS